MTASHIGAALALAGAAPAVDWTAILAALVTTLPATIAAIGALIVSLRGNRRVEALHEGVNGRVDELVKSKSSAAFAAGVLAGRGFQQSESDAAAESPDAAASGLGNEEPSSRGDEPPWRDGLNPWETR